MAKQDKITGFHALEEALEKGTVISKVFLQKGNSDAKQALVKRLKALEIPYQRVPREKLNRMYAGNHQGVLAWISPIEFFALDQWLPGLFETGQVPAIAVLDGITDVRNFGAVARSAECLGVDGLVIPFSKSVTITEDAVKASSGALLNLPVCREKSLLSAVRFLKDSGLITVGITEKAEQPLAEAPLADPFAIVLGAEDVGIDNNLLSEMEHCVKIPMSGHIDSLNVSVSAGIAFYEMSRQRTHTPD